MKDTLWAPWRLEYIRRDEKEDGCFLCRIFAGKDDRTNLVLKRGRTCAIVINRYPYSNGHLMVCPYRHVSELGELTAAERSETMDLLHEGIVALRKTLDPQGFNVGINLGRAAGAGLEEHIHTHLVPRWQGDNNFMPITSQTKVLVQSLDALWEELHPLLQTESSGPRG